jgi:hypothetical protein
MYFILFVLVLIFNTSKALAQAPLATPSPKPSHWNGAEELSELTTLMQNAKRPNVDIPKQTLKNKLLNEFDQILPLISLKCDSNISLKYYRLSYAFIRDVTSAEQDILNFSDLIINNKEILKGLTPECSYNVKLLAIKIMQTYRGGNYLKDEETNLNNKNISKTIEEKK